MITLLSPAKTMDYESAPLPGPHTQPEFTEAAQELAVECRKLSVEELMGLMSISRKLAELTGERFRKWGADATLDTHRPAIQAFKGEAYEGLHVEDFSYGDLEFAQGHLRILSGLYGMLRPLDLIEPYRLDMGIRLRHGDVGNLYLFWRDRLTGKLKEELAASQHPLVINLASNEYFKVLQFQLLEARVIQPIFLEGKDDQFKQVSFHSKRARGLMSRFIIKNRLESGQDLKAFDMAGYRFDASRSTDSQWSFIRFL
ncbi:peroxide stress protein YaaA [Bifidobacterium aemilianum]|uniref:UPF0246 protein CRD60_02555 n=1 Tax=Bifidobacterium aemilianum TaxID=2493120 RepID=A0A366KBP8_9BIFI|nr:peroxide stress protein YaaA [Bifidobacterium aemilianum]RBP98071.1 peroxide stress protein YaaA [Bifidobacterium aemilianum]